MLQLSRPHAVLLTIDVAWQGVGNCRPIGIAGRISQAYRHCRPIGIGLGQISDPSLPVLPHATCTSSAAVQGDRDAGGNAHQGTRHEGQTRAEEGEGDEREIIAGSKPLRRLSWKITIAAAAISMAVAAAAITAAALLSNSSKGELSLDSRVSKDELSSASAESQKMSYRGGHCLSASSAQ